METQSLFCLLSQEDNQIIQPKPLVIDGKFLSMQAIYDYIGETLYKDCRELNPIFENSFYFGKNFDAFGDCLKNYFYELETKANPLQFKLLDWHTSLTGNELFIFINILIENSLNHPIEIFASRAVVERYIEEQLRLIHLEGDEIEF